MTITNFTQVQQALYDLFPTPTSMKEAYNLDSMYALMNLLGNPQNKLKIVHVAGTSGKTSTCYFTTALLVAAGQKVGLAVSPHIDQINERVQLNLTPLNETTFCKYFTEYLAIPGLTELKASYFEAIVGFAFWVFEREKVDYAVIEVGVGGIGDATNVIDRADKVCVLTDIGYDHMQILGDTIEKITAQKAGIVQPHNQAVTLQQDHVIIGVFEATAQKQSANLQIVKPKDLVYLKGLPPFKQRNWQLAYAAYSCIAERDNLPRLTEDQLTKTAHTKIPARMEVVKYKGKTIVLDGSHNQQKLAGLKAGMQAEFGAEPIALLTSFVHTRADRLQDALNEIVPLAPNVIVTSYNTKHDSRHQSLPLSELQAAAEKAGAAQVTAIADPAKAFRALLQQPEKVLLVTGSFYLLNHIRPILKQGDSND